MGMASAQDVPVKKEAPQPWSMRRLLGGGAISNVISKTFINAFDVLLGFSVLVIGIAELAEREVSWLFYVLTILFFFAAFIERRANALTASEKEK